MKHIRRFLILMLAILVVGVAGLVGWATVGAREATERAQDVLSDEQIEREDGRLVFRPNSPASKGFIYYPGGLVDPEAYAVTAQGLADAGYLTVIPKMPLNLAVTDANAADEILASFPEIESWVIGGHSLGGAMAAEYAKNNADQLDGLVLFASFPANTDDFVPSPLPILSVFGSEEGGAPEMAAFAKAVGGSATAAKIDGGNHAQFGDYGLQGGDGVATISAEAQQQQIIAATVTFLQSLE